MIEILGLVKAEAGGKMAVVAALVNTHAQGWDVFLVLFCVLHQPILSLALVRP